MKMVLAIINYDDSQDVISSLMKAGFSITKLATTGGFLKASRSCRQLLNSAWAFSRPRRCRSKSAAQPYLYSTSSVLKSCDFI